MAREGTAPSRVAGRYELLEPLGHGGMGAVWRAHDGLLEREVAVKQVQLPAWLPEGEQQSVRARVMREARAAARLSHPASVTVFDVVEEGQYTYLVMELVEAATLADLVEEQGPLTPERTARIGLEVLGALELAHRQGIVHRDVKPSNIMVPVDGSVKLADFGVASVRDHPAITHTGQLIGSPAYMAPEQAQGETSGPAADLWGLGASLYYAVEGQPPFDKAGAIPTLNAVVHDEPRPPERAGPLAPLLERLLGKDPAGRPAGPALRDQLERVASGHPDDVATAAEAGPAAPADQAAAAAAEAALLVDAAAGPATAPATEAAASVPATPLPGPERPLRPPPSETPAAAAPPPSPGPEPRSVTAARPIPPRGPLVAAVVVVVAVVLAVLAWQAVSDDEEPGSATSPTTAPPSSPTTAAQGPADAAVRTPAGWVQYTDAATGYRIAHPPDWRVQRVDRTRTDFRDPGSGAYLRVDWTDRPKDSPVADWQAQSKSFGTRHAGYEELRIEPAAYRGYNAAIWEYAYSSGSARLHAVDLGFVTGGWGFALNFQTSEEAWESSQDTFEAFKAAFQPPRRPPG